MRTWGKLLRTSDIFGCGSLQILHQLRSSRHRRTVETCRTASLAKRWALESITDPVSKNKVESYRGKLSPLTSDHRFTHKQVKQQTHMYTHTCVMYTYVYIYMWYIHMYNTHIYVFWNEELGLILNCWISMRLFLSLLTTCYRSKHNP